MPADELDAVRRLRRGLSAPLGAQATELLLEGMKNTAGNAEFLDQIRQTAPSHSES